MIVLQGLLKNYKFAISNESLAINYFLLCVLCIYMHVVVFVGVCVTLQRKGPGRRTSDVL